MKRKLVITDALAYARKVTAAAQRGELPPAPLSSVDRVRAWRAANPDKVRAARDRANALRAAAYAAPPGSTCGVCGTSSNVRLDRKRAGTLCPDCGSAVRYVENADRAITYAAEIARYRAGTAERQMA